jgi:hypothetical protein
LSLNLPESAPRFSTAGTPSELLLFSDSSPPPPRVFLAVDLARCAHSFSAAGTSTEPFLSLGILTASVSFPTALARRHAVVRLGFPESTPRFPFRFRAPLVFESGSSQTPPVFVGSSRFGSGFCAAGLGFCAAPISTGVSRSARTGGVLSRLGVSGHREACRRVHSSLPLRISRPRARCLRAGLSPRHEAATARGGWTPPSLRAKSRCRLWIVAVPSPVPKVDSLSIARRSWPS